MKNEGQPCTTGLTIVLPLWNRYLYARVVNSVHYDKASQDAFAKTFRPSLKNDRSFADDRREYFIAFLKNLFFFNLDKEIARNVRNVFKVSRIFTFSSKYMMMTYLTDSAQGTGFSTVNDRFVHFRKLLNLSAMQRNVTYDVVYPMHVWRLFANLKMHARWPRRTLCSSRPHRISAHATWIRERRKKKRKKDIEIFVMEGVGTSTSTLSNGLKRLLMRLRGRSPSYRSGRWVRLIIPSFFFVPCNYDVTKNSS